MDVASAAPQHASPRDKFNYDGFYTAELEKKHQDK